MTHSRTRTFLHALAFVIGFSIVFVALGASVAFVGFALSGVMVWVQRVGGVLLIIFGLATMGLVRLPLLYADRRIHMQARPGWGYLSSVLMGVLFSAGWIPCVGPVLAAIYLLASDTQTVGRGALLLGSYSLGLGLPFLLTGAALGTMSAFLRRLNRHLNIVSKITGLFLIGIGALMLFDRFYVMSNWLIERLGSGLAVAEFAGGTSSVITLPIAFAAGFLSFLSPCVLPLIPGYLGYLSGAVVLESGEQAEQGA